MPRHLVWIVGLALLPIVACVKPNPRVCGDDLSCPDPSLPFCDLDGAIDGTMGTCIAVACSAGEFAVCRGENQAIGCDSTGMNYELSTCEHACGTMGCNKCEPNTQRCNGATLESCDSDGQIRTETCAASCVDGPLAHCAFLVPRYLPEICAIAATTDLVISSDTTLDSKLPANCNGGIVPQNAGEPGICVVRYRSIEVQAGKRLLFAKTDSVNTETNVVALVADESLRIDGIVDVSATGQLNGAGGGYALSGGSNFPTVGGGGAGFITPGAPGGTTSTDGGTSNGGVASTSPSILNSLVGGPHSGSAGGGGGLTLIACRGSVSISGAITAGGGGGNGGIHSFLGDSGGGGGGAGGVVTLQGISVQVTGGLFANGGGGGNGKPVPNTATGGGGQDGLTSATPAHGGGTAFNGEGSGGDGGYTFAPKQGLKSTLAGATPGGGGGSVGYLQAFTPAGTLPTLTPSSVSPAFSPSGTLQTR